MLTVPDIRPATAADATGIAAISRDHIEYGLGWSWTPGRVAHAIADPATNVIVSAKRGEMQGFGIMQYAQHHAHLVLLAVQPVARHQGVGRRLTAWLEQSARVAGIQFIQLEARADNLHAIAFYTRQGYSRVGRVAGYYEGSVDAVKLRKILV